ncbi:MAG: type VI secretion system ATPase TssH, partial [Candidatus Binataceae bacterium]
MILADLKGLVARLNPYSTRALENAAGACLSRTNYEITVEHFLSALLADARCDLNLILGKQGIEGARMQAAVNRAIEDFRTGNGAKPVFSPLLLEWVQDAWVLSSIDLGADRIRSGAMLLALLARASFFASGAYVDLLRGLNRERIMAEFFAVTRESLEAVKAAGSASAATAVDGGGTALARFCMDFTARAREGAIDPVFGRDQEIRQMIDILARRRKNNPICVGDPGVGKTAVVEGLALRVVRDDIPDFLRGVTVLGLDMGLLQAGAGVRGEFENRLKSVITEIKGSAKPIILFIDEAHTLIGAGGQAGGGDAANLLKPALARGELRTIAATTWSEYKKYFEKDAALARRFQLVKLDEPSVDTSVEILRGLKEKYEQAHGVIVRDDAIVAAADLANRYISGRQLPDKAVDLLDTSAARVRVSLTAKPDALDDCERHLESLERERHALERDRDNGQEVDGRRLEEIGQKAEELSKAAAGLRERWQTEQTAAQKVIEARGRVAALNGAGKERDAAARELKAAAEGYARAGGGSPLLRLEVDPDVVAKVVSDWTGIPLGKVMRDQARGVLNLADNLKTRVKGQDQALDLIARVVKSAKSGLKDPAQPLGVFLLAGPSGVGKTETALAVADLLFGGEHSLVTLNMSEFQEKHTVSRLVGSPPGYVGYGEGGVLTEAVRQRPYATVLLDEAEKAHLDVLNLFY